MTGGRNQTVHRADRRRNRFGSAERQRFPTPGRTSVGRNGACQDQLEIDYPRFTNLAIGTYRLGALVRGGFSQQGERFGGTVHRFSQLLDGPHFSCRETALHGGSAAADWPSGRRSTAPIAEWQMSLAPPRSRLTYQCAEARERACRGSASAANQQSAARKERGRRSAPDGCSLRRL